MAGHAGETHPGTTADNDAASGGLASILAVPVVFAAILLAGVLLYGRINKDQAATAFILLFLLIGFLVMAADALQYVNLKEKPAMALEKMEAIPETTQPLTDTGLLGGGGAIAAALLVGAGLATLLGRIGIGPATEPAEPVAEQEDIAPATEESGEGGAEVDDEWMSGEDDSEVGNW